MAEDPQIYDADATEATDGDEMFMSGNLTALTPVVLPPAGALSVPHSSPPAAPAAAFSRDQLDLIKRTVALGTSDDEFLLFVEVCRLTGLNPFARQIYAIMRNAGKDSEGNLTKRMTIQTGIDGYLAIASRTGEFAGMDDVLFDTEKGDNPTWARVTVYRLVQGARMPFTATARWREYVQLKDVWVNNRKTGEKVPTEMWARMPWTMLGKCARALALRLAFPAELGGVYTADEMAQADNPANSGSVESGTTSAATRPQASQPQASQRRPASADMRKPAPTTAASAPAAASDAEPTDAALPTWPELSAEAQALDVPIAEWRQQITTLTGKAQRTDPKTGKTITISAQLTDDDKRTMMSWLAARRKQFEDAAAATPPLESLQYAGH